MSKQYIADKFTISGGTSGQFLKADGTLDSTNYLTTTGNTRIMYNNSSTGLISGGTLTTATTTTFNVSAGNGIIVDNASDPNNPTFMNISWSGFTNQSVIGLGTEPAMYLLVSSGGTLTKTNIIPKSSDIRSGILLGAIISLGTAITSTHSAVVNVASPVAQLADLANSIGIFAISGNRISNNVGNLTLNKSAGYSFNMGGNFHVDRTNPNLLISSGLTAPNLLYLKQDYFLTANTNSIDTNNYDLNGVITPLASNRYAAHRIWFRPNSNRVFFQYGQASYATLTQARDQFQSEDYITPPSLTTFAYLIAVIVVRKGETNLDNPAYSEIIPQGKFAGTGGSGGSTPTLQSVYDASTNPEILTDSTRNALSIRNGSGSADSATNLFEGMGSGGTITSSITAGGSFSGISFIKSGGTSTQYLMANGSVSTLTNPVIGTGTTNNIPKWTNLNSLGDSLINDNGTSITVKDKVFIETDNAIGLQFTNKTDNNKQLLIGYDSAGNYSSIQSIQQGTSTRPLILNPLGGNIGFGTTSPNGKLDALGDNNNSSLTFNTPSLATIGSTIRQLAINSNFNGSDYFISLQARTNASSASSLLLNPLGGNIGINTTNPTEKLQVTGNILASGSRPIVLNTGSGSVEITANAGGWVDGLLLKGSSGTLLSVFGAFGTSDTLTYTFIGEDYNNPDIAILPNGNVGITKNDPQAKLHVVGGGVATNITTSLANANLKLDLANPAISIAFGYTNDSSIDTGYIQAGNSSNNGKPLLLNPYGGNIGIGTVAPTSAKLQVYNNNSAGAGWSGYFIGASSAARDILLAGQEGFSNGFTVQYNGTEMRYYFLNGKVAIGHNAPSEALHVVGNILASGTITPSDRRLKSNITPLENSLEKVMLMEPVSYDKAWELEGEVKGSEFGFVAQDLKEIFPNEEIVKTPEQENDIMSVNYNSLIAVLTKAIQEQNEIILSLKERIEILENK